MGGNLFLAGNLGKEREREGFGKGFSKMDKKVPKIEPKARSKPIYKREYTKIFAAEGGKESKMNHFFFSSERSEDEKREE